MSETNSTTQSGVRQIQLTQGKVALVDDEDYERVNQYKWSANYSKGRWHARRNGSRPKRATIRLHRFITNASDDEVVDHINGDPLDNRRSNLRLCTNAENIRNQRTRRQVVRPRSSRFKGVTWDKRGRKWRSQISVNHQRFNLGGFSTEEEAHKAYCRASSQYHGQFGRTE